MHPKDAAVIANSVDPDRGAVLSGSALFAQAYLSENLGSYGTWKHYYKFVEILKDHPRRLLN